MSTSQTAPRTELASLDKIEPAASNHPDSTTLLTLLSDEYIRNILSCLGESSYSARALAEQMDASRATVYRRLDRLTEAGLVTSTVSIDSDGHHRQEFAVDADLATIQFGADGVTATVEAY
jgi:DNA-binding transcriptional ArsR family regulator